MNNLEYSVDSIWNFYLKLGNNRELLTENRNLRQCANYLSSDVSEKQTNGYTACIARASHGDFFRKIRVIPLRVLCVDRMIVE